MPVRVALVEAKAITARFAVLTEHQGPFACSECGRKVFLKACPRGLKQPHFSHFVGHEADGGGCGESSAHAEAKLEFTQELERWTVVQRCRQCRREVKRLRFVDLRAQLEFALQAGGRQYRVDVALLENTDRLRCAVEVWHTHAIEAQKREDLLTLANDVVELRAEDILRCVRAEASDFLLDSRTVALCGGCQWRRAHPELQKCSACCRWRADVAKAQGTQRTLCVDCRLQCVNCEAWLPDAERAQQSSGTTVCEPCRLALREACAGLRCWRHYDRGGWRHRAHLLQAWCRTVQRCAPLDAEAAALHDALPEHVRTTLHALSDRALLRRGVLCVLLLLRLSRPRAAKPTAQLRRKRPAQPAAQLPARVLQASRQALSACLAGDESIELQPPTSVSRERLLQAGATWDGERFCVRGPQALDNCRAWLPRWCQLALSTEAAQLKGRDEQRAKKKKAPPGR